MTDLHVGPSEVRALAAQLRSESAHISGALSGLASEMMRLRAGWSGDAQRSYDAARSEWTATLARMNDVLARVSAAAEAGADAYVKADRSASRGFGRG